ncbi:MAG: LPXTG cell wall anchor domain-containing protein [Clostridia bacterium]|nr:LPXTG cell wall anchor domain-containing protein [Clostridia bacterium]
MKKLIAITLAVVMMLALCIVSNAADPALVVTGEQLYELLDTASNSTVATEVREEGGVKYINFTVADNNDPWLTFKTPLEIGSADKFKYVAVKYRSSNTNSTTTIDFYLEIAEPHAVSPQLTTDGEWHTVVADLSKSNIENMASIWSGKVSRFDFMAGDGTNWAIDIEFLAFFDNEADANAYTGPNASEGGLRDFDTAKGDKLSYDQILVNGAEIANGNDAVIAAKKLVDGSDGSISTIAMHGWFGNANSKIASYGYTIDGGEPVYGDFAVAAEQDVINAGGESRYTVSVDVTGLQDGEEHEIWVVVRLENGDIVKLNRYDNRGQEGGKDREVYVNYKAPLTEVPPVTQPETTPQTGDSALVMFAVLAVLAMGIAVVFAKKRSF